MLYVAKAGIASEFSDTIAAFAVSEAIFLRPSMEKTDEDLHFFVNDCERGRGFATFFEVYASHCGTTTGFPASPNGLFEPAFKQLTAFPKNAKRPAHTFIYIDTPARERSRRFTKRHLCPLHKQKANAILRWPYRPAHPTPSRQMWNNRAGKTGLQKDGKL